MMNLTANVEVRRHNGQCSYGPWLPIDNEDVPDWVNVMVGDEIAENDADEGFVCGATSMWAWRKS